MKRTRHPRALGQASPGPDDLIRMKSATLGPAVAPGKPQQVRLLDVFALGPFLVYAGLTRRPLGPFGRFALVFAGVATVVYNWRNYQAVRARQKETPPF